MSDDLLPPPADAPFAPRSGEKVSPQATDEGPRDAGNAPPADDGWQWAIVEIFGHRSHAGRTREEERFGAKLLRVDIPVDGDAAAKGWKTVYYAGASLFSFTPCTEETAVRINRPYARPALTHLRGGEDKPDDPDEEEF